MDPIARTHESTTAHDQASDGRWRSAKRAATSGAASEEICKAVRAGKLKAVHLNQRGDVRTTREAGLLSETGRGIQGHEVSEPGHLPRLLTPKEVAGLLRTSKKAIYAMIERAQLPGVVRIGRRVLLREADLLDWVRQNTTPSLER